MITPLRKPLRRQLEIDGHPMVVRLALSRDGELLLELRQKRHHRGWSFNLSFLLRRVADPERPGLRQLSLFDAVENHPGGIR